MKNKVTLLLLLQLFAVVFLSAQTYTSLPFTEHFENDWINGTDTRDLPSVSWKNTPATGGNSWSRDDDGKLRGAWLNTNYGYNPTGCLGSSHSARFHTCDVYNGISGTLDLYVDFSTIVGDKILSFYSINQSGNDSLEILISTNDGANFTGIGKKGIQTSWEQTIIDLGNIVATNGIIRFKAISDWEYSDIGFDEVKIISEASLANITSFSVPNQVGNTVINDQDSTISFLLPFSVDVTSMIANFTLSSGASVKVGTTLQVSGTTSNNFTSPVIYSVIAADGVTKKNWTVYYTCKKVAIKKASNAPTLDGLNNEWGAIIPKPIATAFTGESNGFEDGNDLKAYWKSAWCDSGLFILVQVERDDVHWDSHSKPSNGYQWHGDLSEIYFDVNAILADQRGSNSGFGHYQFAGWATDSTQLWGTKSKKITKNNKNNNTYCQELFVHKDDLRNSSNIALTPAAGIIYGFDVTIADNDGPEKNVDGYRMRSRKVWINDGSVTPECWVNMDSAGIVVLVSDVATISESVNSETKITSYTLPNQLANSTIDDIAKTITIPMPSGSDVSNLIASFSTSVGATVKVGITSQISGTTANDLTLPVTYIVTAANGTNTENWTVIVKTPNVASLPFIEHFDNTWVSLASNRDVPSLNWINNPSTGKNAWSRDDDGVYRKAWTTNISGAYTPAGCLSSAHSARFHSVDVSTGLSGILDLNIDFSSALGNKALTYYYINTNGSDSLKVYLSINGGVTFTEIDKKGISDTWSKTIINLGNITATNGIIRFKATSDYGNTDLGLDEVNIFSSNALAEISNFSIPNQRGNTIINTTNSTITIIAKLGTDITNLVADFTTFSGSVVKIGSTIQVSGTTTNNFSSPVTYEVTAADGTTIKNWVVTVKRNLAASLPFVEHFDGTWISFDSNRDVPSINWISTPSTGENSWSRSDDGVSRGAWTYPYGNYSPTGAMSTTNSARFHSYSAPYDSAGTLDLIVDFSTLTGSKALSFYSINSSGSDSLKVFISINGGLSFTEINKKGIQIKWEKTIIDLGNITASNGIIRFKATSDWSYDIGLDEINIFASNTLAEITSFSVPNQTGNSIIDPINGTISIALPLGSNLTNLVPIFTSSNGSTAKIGSTPQVSGTTSSNFTSPVTYTITAADGTTIKNWIVTIKKNTSASLPFVENFENTWTSFTSNRDVPSLNWINTPSTGENSWSRNDDGVNRGAWMYSYGDYFPAGAISTNYSARFHSYSASNNTSGTLDLNVDFSTLTGDKTLSFYYNNTSGTDSLKVYLSTNGGTSFTEISEKGIQTEWDRSLVSLGNTSATNGILRFKAISDLGSTDIGLDEVSIVATNSFAEITNLNLPNQIDGTIINTTSGTITLVVPYGANVTNLIASFTLSAGSSVKVGSLTQVSGITPNNFTTPVTYIVTAADGITTKNWVVTATIDVPRLTASLKKATNAPLIDGNNTEWNAVTSNPIAKTFIGEDDGFENDDDLKAYWKSAWCDSGLFVLVQIEKDDVHWDKKSSPANGYEWESDISEVCFDMNPVRFDHKGPSSFGSGHFQLSGWSDDSTMFWKTKSFKVTKNNSINHTYCQEMFFHKSDLKDIKDIAFSPVAGATFGFDLTIADNDGPDKNAGSRKRSRKVWMNDGSGTGLASGENYFNMDNSGTVAFLPDLVALKDVLNNQVQITSFTIANQIGNTVINTTAKTITLTMPFGTNTTSLIGAYTASSGSTIKIGTTIQASGTNANNFTNPVIYSVLAEDGITTQNWTVTVTVAQNSATAISLFSINGQLNSSINATSKTISVTMPYGSNVTIINALYKCA
jgi:hypothetical protein